MAGIAEYLDECYREEFVRVVEDWGIPQAVRTVGSLGAYYDAKADGAVVRLLNDRGCVWCEVAPDNGSNEFVNVELLSEVLDHKGSPADAKWFETRRQTLAEQCRFLIEHKAKILEAVSAKQWTRTQAVAVAIGQDRFRKMFGKAIQSEEPR